MTDPNNPVSGLPATGGSFMRAPDGTLHPAEQTAAEATPANDTPQRAAPRPAATRKKEA